MKKIYFDDLRDNSIMLSSIAFILLSILILFLLSIRKSTDSLIVSLYCIIPFFSKWGRVIILPRYISWSESYIKIKLNKLFSKKIRFRQVLEVTQLNRKIIFWKANHKQVEVDFSRYSEADFVKFLNIISKNLTSKAHFKEKPTWIQS
ncbi:MAG: hypothetical protein ACI85I_002019 [Arenicella sp.]|jgi:hypothetical protein